MSDRSKPSKQITNVASGTTYHSSSTRHSITRDRPGAMSPGGVGVDIKHNSYERYLNRIKGRAPLRRGIILPNYGQYIPFNRAFPIYGGKTVKTAIVNGCPCEPKFKFKNINNDLVIVYNGPHNAIQDQLYSITYQYHIGDYVWVLNNENIFTKAIIINIQDDIYTIQYTNILNPIIENVTKNQLFIYFNCDCNCTSNLSIQEKLLNGSNQQNLAVQLTSENNIYCDVLNNLSELGLLND